MRSGLRIALGAGAVLIALSFPAAASASPGQALQVSTVVNGQSAATSSDARPAQLYANRPVELRVRLHNTGTSRVYVAAVRFEGQVLSLPLFSYDTTLDVTVKPGATDTVNIPISTNGIGGLATGLIVASVTLVGRDGAALASQSVVTHVHGSLQSIYGLFGLVVLVLTISSLVFAVVALVRRTLPENRWARALRFGVPGFGVGLVLTFTTAAFAIFSPAPGHWLALLVVPTAAGFALGFLTPGPDEEEFDDYDEDVLVAQIVVVDDEPPPVPADAAPAWAVGPDGAVSRPTAGPPVSDTGSRSTVLP